MISSCSMSELYTVIIMIKLLSVLFEENEMEESGLKINKKGALEFLGVCAIIGVVTGLINPTDATTTAIVSILCAVVLAIVRGIIEFYNKSKK